MPIFQAIGFGILLIVLRLMLPDVLHEGQRTAVLFLQGASASALTATDLIEQASTTSSGTALPSSTAPVRRLTLPQAPYPVPF